MPETLEPENQRLAWMARDLVVGDIYSRSGMPQWEADEIVSRIDSAPVFGNSYGGRSGPYYPPSEPAQAIASGPERASSESRAADAARALYQAVSQLARRLLETMKSRFERTSARRSGAASQQNQGGQPGQWGGDHANLPQNPVQDAWGNDIGMTQRSPVQPMPQIVDSMQQIEKLTPDERAIVALFVKDIIEIDRRLQNAYAAGSLPNARNLIDKTFPSSEVSRQNHHYVPPTLASEYAGDRRDQHDRADSTGIVRGAVENLSDPRLSSTSSLEYLDPPPANAVGVNGRGETSDAVINWSRPLPVTPGAGVTPAPDIVNKYAGNPKLFPVVAPTPMGESNPAGPAGPGYASLAKKSEGLGNSTPSSEQGVTSKVWANMVNHSTVKARSR